MRTDSTRVSDDALTAVRGHIEAELRRAVPAGASRTSYASGKSAQEAHEAIRPTDLALHAGARARSSACTATSCGCTR